MAFKLMTDGRYCVTRGLFKYFYRHVVIVLSLLSNRLNQCKKLFSQFLETDKSLNIILLSFIFRLSIKSFMIPFKKEKYQISTITHK